MADDAEIAAIRSALSKQKAARTSAGAGDVKAAEKPTTLYVYEPGPVQGMVKIGTVDLTRQPTVKNPDGSVSTVHSIGVGFDDGEYVLPTVTPDGRSLTEEQAIAEFRKTGLHLGVFKDQASADAYAQALHKAYEQGLIPDNSR